MNYQIKECEAICTCGGCYLFVGSFTNGEFFSFSNDLGECVLVTDEHLTNNDYEITDELLSNSVQLVGDQARSIINDVLKATDMVGLRFDAY